MAPRLWLRAKEHGHLRNIHRDECVRRREFYDAQHCIRRAVARRPSAEGDEFRSIPRDSTGDSRQHARNPARKQRFGIELPERGLAASRRLRAVKVVEAAIVQTPKHGPGIDRLGMGVRSSHALKVEQCRRPGWSFVHSKVTAAKRPLGEG